MRCTILAFSCFIVTVALSRGATSSRPQGQTVQSSQGVQHQDRSLVLGVWFQQAEDGNVHDSRGNRVLIYGQHEWVRDPDVKSFEHVPHFTSAYACWDYENAFALKSGTITAWINYEGGQGSIAGKGTKNNDEYSLAVWDRMLGSWMGWPDGQQLLSSEKMPLGKWVFVAYAWDAHEATFWINGKSVGARKLSVPLKLDRGRFEIGVNSPGTDEFIEGKFAGVHLYRGKFDDRRLKEVMNAEKSVVGIDL